MPRLFGPVSGWKKGRVGSAKVLHGISRLNHVALPVRLEHSLSLRMGSPMRVFVSNSRVVLGGCGPGVTYTIANRMSSSGLILLNNGLILDVRNTGGLVSRVRLG